MISGSVITLEQVLETLNCILSLAASQDVTKDWSSVSALSLTVLLSLVEMCLSSVYGAECCSLFGPWFELNGSPSGTAYTASGVGRFASRFQVSSGGATEETLCNSNLDQRTVWGSSTSGDDTPLKQSSNRIPTARIIALLCGQTALKEAAGSVGDGWPEFGQQKLNYGVGRPRHKGARA